MRADGLDAAAMAGPAKGTAPAGGLPPELFRGHRPQDLASISGGASESEFFSPTPAGYVRGRHKYVIVLGTVMSGLGKGIFSSSLAKMMKDKGLVVAPIKMEGYLNMD